MFFILTLHCTKKLAINSPDFGYNKCRPTMANWVLHNSGQVDDWVSIFDQK